MAEENQSDISQEVAALRDVAEDLSELLTNSVNMVDKYYEIFFDQNPHYVELEQYGSDGQLHITLVPNRAMDKTIALSGDEDPEGVVEAVMGALYINTITRELFLKKTAIGKTGWSNITPQRMDVYKETFNVDSETYAVQLTNSPYAKNYVDVYVNGRHLEQADFELKDDKKTLEFNVQFADESIMQVSYLDGIYGIKGDTALTFQVGDVTQVEPDEPARVENVGTNKDIILEFDIPKGESGDSGVYVGPTEPTNDERIWIDTSASGFSTDELSVSRIVDSGNNINPTAYKKACQIMHSTADESKFTLFGDVFLDDNGYLTVRENSAGLRTPVKVKQLTNRNWVIQGRDYVKADANTYQYMLTIGTIDGQGCTFYFAGNDHSFKYTDRNNNQSTDLFTNTSLYTTYGEGWYNWKIEYINGSYKFYMSFGSNDLALQYTRQFTNINQPLETYVYIASDNVYTHSSYYSDVKVFAIYIDGVLVYTPNKTGIHYIYNNHFDKVGNPTILEEGILTRVMNGKHYIYGDLTAGELLNTSWDIQGHFKHLRTPEVLWQFSDIENVESVSLEEDNHAGNYKMLSAAVEENDKLIFYLVTGTSTAHSTTHHFDFNLTLNHTYYYKMSHSLGSKYTFTLSEHADFSNPTILTYNANTANVDPYVSNVYPNYVITMGTNNTIENTENIVYNNLNYFKINIHDKFAYRPLLRIPCTFSKYGALFVEPSQTEVVREAYRVHGIGNIYVLDEVNRSVILPLSDIYSLVEKEYQSRPTIGKGLLLDERQNLLENLVEGMEIGDIGEAVAVDETIGTRSILDGKIINYSESTKDFFEYVESLRPKGFVVTEAEWQAEKATLGYCTKFVINSSTSTRLDHYYAYIPDSMIIRTPVIIEEDDEGEELPRIFCTNCGTELSYDQAICTNCFTVNDRYYGVNIGETNSQNGESITDEQTQENQQGLDLSEPEDESENAGTQQTIVYTTSISPNLTEADIIYTTSQDPLSEGTVFKKINNIIYPVTDVTVNDLLNTDLYTRHATADFEQTVTVINENFVRIPYLTSSRTGYSCYIQIATGVKNNVNIENDYHNISPYAFGMYQYADVDINNAGWLLSNGSWYSGDMYPTFYDWIKTQAEIVVDTSWVQPKFNSNYLRQPHGVYYWLTASHGTPYIAFNQDLTGENAWWSNHGATSTSNPCWIAFHSSINLVFSKVSIMNETATPSSFKTGLLQVSHDNVNWKTICTINNPNNDVGYVCEQVIDWTNTTDTFTQDEIRLGFPHIRLYFTASWGSGGVSIQTITYEATKVNPSKFKKYNNPAYSITDYDFVVKESDRTFRLPNIANACDYSKMRYLVESKEMSESDQSWYNLYSDGWLEQGNYQKLWNAVSKNWTDGPLITMPKAYKNTVYNVTIGGQAIYAGDYGTATNVVKNNNQQWHISGYNVGDMNGYWTAKGYAVPPAFDTYRHLLPRLYYYVGDTLQTRKHINMAELANQFAEFKSAPILTAPQRTYQELNCPASGQTVVAPGDGWMYLKRTSTATNQYLALYDTETGMGELQWIAANSNWAQVIIPVYKGQVITVNYSAGTHDFLRFVASVRGLP